ncbi:hypothetical protein M8994_17340 [Brucella sp. 21LCYQ03]|nr:hypothetical protein [Brucella sp. 21LCYQ03]
MRPAPPVETILHRVTYHAVTRYVQRILGVAIPTEKGTTEIIRAAIHCKRAKTTIDEVRRLIMIPTVAVAIENKFAAIDTKNFTAVFDPEQQIVVTILEPQKYKQPNRRKSTSRSEKQCHRIAERVGMQIKGINSRGRK